MRLKKLELYGFKSFPQRTEIVFNEGITGIVGPNGSGKSNIGDAVRWVLGEQSPKTLRGASMADVIFNGTQKRKPLSYCEVSLTFENDDHALKVDYAEVTVTRRVYRSGEGEYYLNRSACRLKDIIDLFRDTGIGREGYSIIGQGRIDEILSRKSEDRRQVFEEAAGIVRYKARKEEADKRLANTLQNASRVDDILEELNRQLGPLEKQSRDARTYLQLSGQLKTLDLNLFLIRSDRFNQRIAELDQELMNLQTVLDDNTALLQQRTEARDQHQSSIEDYENRITQARTDQLNCTDELHQAETQLTEVQTRRSARAQNRGRLQAEQQDAAARIEQLFQLEHSGGQEITAQQELAAKADEALTDARTQLFAAQLQQKQAEDALESHKAAIMQAMDRTAAAANDRTRLQTMQGQMSKRAGELQAGLTALQEQEQQLLTRLTEAQEDLTQEEQQALALSRAADEARAESERGEQRMQEQRTQAEELSAQLQEKQTRWKLLNEMTREMDGYTQSVRRAIQYGRSSGMRGVQGALAQLIRVPQQVQTAIDMALGAAKENIVTDTEETAKALIDYLRQNRLGRATFLPMSAIRPHSLNNNERRVLSMPGCMGVASELVETDPAYRGIIDNLLGRTVIADNLEHGIAIMRAGGHAFRLVTLMGDVMHSGGSMTGGSAQARTTGLLSREREVQELAEQLKQGKVRFDQMKEDLKARQQELISLRQRAGDALTELHQQEIAVTRASSHVTAAQDALDDHRERMTETQEAIDQLTEALEGVRQELEGITERHDTEELDRSAMEARTQELQDALYAARENTRLRNEDVVNRSLQLSDANHTLDVMTRDAGRRRQDAARLKADMQRRDELLAQMAQQQEEDVTLEAQRSQAAETLRAELRKRDAAVTGLESQRNALQQTLRQVLQDMENLHEVLSRDGERKHRAEMSRSKADTDLRSLQDRIWNTWQLTYAGAEEFRVTEGFNVPEAERTVASLNARIRALGHVNVNAVEEYNACKQRFDELSVQQQDLKKAESDLRTLIDQLVQQMKVTFVESFTQLQVYFSETFVRLFGGGKAELKLTDPSDPLNCGIEINAQPPGKKLQLLSLLSGGERALCAISILFAMLRLKPTPFCILDEIEAALDDANISYYADYLREFSLNTQFIVVTHRKGTMERCNALYGVAMEEQGVSRMVSVSLQDYQE